MLIVVNIARFNELSFLLQTTPPPYSVDAEQCVVAGDYFFEDTTCTDYYRALGLRSSASAVNSAATAICANETCLNRMGSYIDYLITCRLGSIEDDDDDDNDNVCCMYIVPMCDFTPFSSSLGSLVFI